MKKTLGILLILTLLCAAVTAQAITKEEPEPLVINPKISLVDYGFAAAGPGGFITDLYGYILQSDEQTDVSGKTPCIYIKLRNDTDTDQNVKVYLRGGNKFNCYWRDSFLIPAGEMKIRFFGGHKKITTYCGSWSLDLTGKNGLVRFTMDKE
ncbi:MAG: hypothetical protein IJ573_10560 [Clostridia bacterium]|nr:hypothetical protein [Clostridia bacterium]